MLGQTVLLIILAAIIAIGVAALQYIHNTGSSSKRELLLAFLRFLSVFIVLLLLINPKFRYNATSIEKPTLYLLADRSESIGYLGQEEQLSEQLKKLQDDESLNQQFDIQTYGFSNMLHSVGKVSAAVQRKETNIAKSLQQLANINTSGNRIHSAVILLSDGNQTFGPDYEYVTRFSTPVFPVAFGDTVFHSDLKIERINTNRYAFLKNRFPVELIASYNGDIPVNTTLEIRNGNKVVYKEKVSFSSTNNSKVFHIELGAEAVGLLRLEAVIDPFADENNKENNRKKFAVEVIDQQTKVAIISTIPHPDISALKQAIEANEQRTAELYNDKLNEIQINDYQLFILKDVNNKFKSLFDKLMAQKKNIFLITGPDTDWNFLNTIQNKFERELTFEEEGVQPVYNRNYQLFQFEDIGFSDYPPLESSFGDLMFFTPVNSLLDSKIGNVETDMPLMVSFEENNRREVVLFGSGLWKWRAKSYLDNKNFNKFDNFIGNIVQYLSAGIKRDRLNVDFESFYYGNSNISVTATFFDKNYLFNPNEELQINIKDKEKNKIVTFPFLLKNNYYEVDLSSLDPGDYEFKVFAKSENISKSGDFTILEYNAEQQQSNANVEKLKRLALNSAGTFYHNNDTGLLIEQLITDNRFKPVYTSKEIQVPLISWKWLLGILTIVLSTEWFYRKYNGLV